ncbi:hypothetical protein [Clostridium sp. VAP52]|uniref:hypothetical protein n=1 Tax=Clostridium sp. VAP52 TaxID=2949977 RepID=UPI00207AEE5E|nr:hypothetical protein [Clostridium sp. VAP52]
MINKNVQLWISKDENSNFITIDKAENSKDYYCCECGSVVHSRALNSEYVTSHFYHLNKGDCSCYEAIKQYWKEYIVNIGEIIELSKVCKVTCIDKRIDFELHKNNTTVKVDLMIKTVDNKFIIITFNKDSEYLDKLKMFDYTVFYADVKKLQHNKQIDSSMFELLYYKSYGLDSELETIRNNMKELYKNEEYYKANKFVYRLSKLLEDIENIKVKWLYNYTNDLFKDKWNGYVYHKVIKLLNELCKKMIEYKTTNLKI